MFRILYSVIFMFFVFSGSLNAAPLNGKIIKLRQPDGTKITARAYGDEYYQRIESLDGYTLVQDRKTGWIHYATLSSNGERFVPGPQRYSDKPGSDTLPKRASSTQQLASPIKLPVSSVRAIAQRNRNLLHAMANSQLNSYDVNRSVLSSITAPTAVGASSIVGLTLLIDFPDEPAAFARVEIDEFLNTWGYTRFNNNGSVREYFFDISDGALDYTNLVPAFYTAQNPKAYYTDPSIDFGVRARKLVAEALQHLIDKGFDFQNLSVDNFGRIRALNVFYAGDVDTGWSQGLWPHQSVMSFASGGVEAGKYQITNMGEELTIGTFCHENGHMLMNWPDLYDTDSGYGHTGIGGYGLMAGGGLADGGRNPVPPNPFFREMAGWELPEELPVSTSDIAFSYIANSHASYKYNNPDNASEFYMIEARVREGRNAELPDEGLMIWHIDTQGNNSFNEMTAEKHFMVSLIQADGQFDLENARGGDAGDLFHADYNDEFSFTSQPASIWWDGTASGFIVNEISDVGSIMSFNVATRSASVSHDETAPPVANHCEFIIQSEWNSGLVAMIRITNPRDTTINGWQITWQLGEGQRMINFWNANVSGSDTYTATPLNWNQQIQPGERVEFGVLIQKSSQQVSSTPVISGEVCH